LKCQATPLCIGIFFYTIALNNTHSSHKCHFNYLPSPLLIECIPAAVIACTFIRLRTAVSQSICIHRFLRQRAVQVTLCSLLNLLLRNPKAFTSSACTTRFQNNRAETVNIVEATWIESLGADDRIKFLTYSQ
jgi:hypothetical protein